MHTNHKLDNISHKVLAKMQIPVKDEYGSILLIIMITGIILSLIRVIQECSAKKILRMDKKHRNRFVTEQIKTLSTKRTWINQMRLRRLIKQKLSPEDYKLYGYSLAQAIMDVGIDFTEEESQTLLEAVDV